MNRLNLIVLGICFLGGVKAQNEMNEDSRKTTVVAPIQQPVYAKIGDRLSLTCEQSDGNEVQWLKDGQIIDTSGSDLFTLQKKDSNGQQLVSSTLIKAQTEEGDKGVYSCKPKDGSEDQAYNVEVFVFEVETEDGWTNKTRTDSVSIGCTVIDLTTYTLRWARNGKELKIDEEKYSTESSGQSHNLTIYHVVEGDEGLYQCVVSLANGANFTTNVALNMSAQVHSFMKSRNIIQGDPLQMDCKAYGWPVPEITWYKEEAELDYSDTRIKVSNVTTEHNVLLLNASIRIENLDFDDRAKYSCEARNDHGINSADIQVRVKDKLAALWPFLGICAEVAILCAIIFIYEKRRAKKMEEEERKEEADHLTNSHAHRGNDDIRQRK